MNTSPVAVDSLVELGFSTYEARAYVGLLAMDDSATGYALSNATGIPQPKVYETLRRLVEKRAVVQVDSDPARFAPTAPSRLLSMLDEAFRARLTEAEEDLSRLAVDPESVEIMPVRRLNQWVAIRRRAEAIVNAASRHIYVSGHSDQLSSLTECVESADVRGVRVDVLHFGSCPLVLQHGRSLQHASTDGVVYRKHQARHLALVGDGSSTLWALAPSGDDWAAMWDDDPMFAAVVKGYIRHDMYVQQIYRDFRSELESRYGPGLERVREGEYAVDRGDPEDGPERTQRPA